MFLISYRYMSLRRRISFTIGDEQAGGLRVTVPLLPAFAFACLAMTVPILMGLGARWSASTTIADLRARKSALEIENANYREATGQLANQISSLQSAIDQLGEHARVDPATTRAMAKLPSVVKSRAMGGAATPPMAGSLLSGPVGSPDTVLGVLSDLLGVIGTRLESVRDTVERRRALAIATPSIWPVAGWLTSAYGSRQDPFTGGDGFHPGLDISAEYGQPIVATGDATVESAGGNGSYGNMVILDHGFGITTRYGHLSRIAVAEGDHVTRGQVIGYVGSTGRSTGAHLHYEVWMNGRLTNPLHLLARP